MQKKDTTCESKCRHFFNWFAQLGVLATLIFLLISIIGDDGDLLGPAIGSFVTFYILYIIMCFCSPTFRYLINKHKADSIHNHMEKLYYTPPTVTFHAVCYHYETYHYTETDSDGKTHHRTRTERVVTHSEYENFRFCSWRDVSGCFLLDSEKFLRKENSQKVYIKLELDLDFDFADDMSRYDYEMQKTQFKMRNIYRDVHMDFTETQDISGFTKYNLVRITEETPACLNCGVYLLFTFIIPVVEFYKIYINSFCIQQDYTLKKVMSTRYNLNVPNEEFNNRFQNNVPKLIIYGEEINFNNAPTDFNKVYDLPTEEELSESKKYTSSKIGSKFNKKDVTTLNKADFNNNSTNLNIINTNPNYNGNYGAIDNSEGVPMMQGGSIPMINTNNAMDIGAPMIQGGSDPMFTSSDGLKNGNGNDLEKKLLDK